MWLRSQNQFVDFEAIKRRISEIDQDSARVLSDLEGNASAQDALRTQFKRALRNARQVESAEIVGVPVRGRVPGIPYPIHFGQTITVRDMNAEEAAKRWPGRSWARWGRIGLIAAAILLSIGAAFEWPSQLLFWIALIAWVVVVWFWSEYVQWRKDATPRYAFTQYVEPQDPLAAFRTIDIDESGRVVSSAEWLPALPFNELHVDVPPPSDWTRIAASRWFESYLGLVSLALLAWFFGIPLLFHAGVPEFYEIWVGGLVVLTSIEVLFLVADRKWAREKRKRENKLIRARITEEQSRHSAELAAR